MAARDPHDLLVRNCAQLATAQGSRAAAGPEASRLGLLPAAAVLCRGGRITWVGAEADLPGIGARRVLDAGGGTLVPGFVDAHTHAVFAGWRDAEYERRLEGQSYSEIAAAGGGITATMRATRAASRDQLRDALVARMDTALLQGTTTCEVKSGYGLDVETELACLRAVREASRRHAVELVPTFLGAHSVPPEYQERREDYVRLVIEQALPAVAAEGLAAFCDVFCEEGVFTVPESRRILLAARAHGLRPKVHCDELTWSGAAELAGELGAVSAEHLIAVSDEGIAALARAGTVAVLLPTTSLALRGAHAPAARLRAAGVPMAVASDFNPGTSPTCNLQLAASLACLQCGLLPAEALTALTLNAAAAVGRADTLGTLEVGKQADLVVLDAPSYLHVPYRLGTNLVRHVVKAGTPVVVDGRLTDAARIAASAPRAP
jgi:imidazolonepropionase